MRLTWNEAGIVIDLLRDRERDSRGLYPDEAELKSRIRAAFPEIDEYLKREDREFLGAGT